MTLVNLVIKFTNYTIIFLTKGKRILVSGSHFGKYSYITLYVLLISLNITCPICSLLLFQGKLFSQSLAIGLPCLLAELYSGYVGHWYLDLSIELPRLKSFDYLWKWQVEKVRMVTITNCRLCCVLFACLFCQNKWKGVDSILTGNNFCNLEK